MPSGIYLFNLKVLDYDINADCTYRSSSKVKSSGLQLNEREQPALKNT